MIKRKVLGGILGGMALVALSVPVCAEVVDRIVAIVNEDIVTLSQLNKITASYEKQIHASDETPERKKGMVEKIQRDGLQQLVEQALVRQEALKNNIRVNDRDVENAIENFKKSNALDQEALVTALEAQGLTFEDYQAKIRQDILQSMLISRAVRSKAIITDEEVKAHYDNNPASFQGVRKHELCNILMADGTGIEDIRQKIANGSDFQEMAKAHSLASNASDGGALGVFDINSFSQAIRDAVKDLKVGETSEVIPTGQGFQLIYVKEIMMADGQTLEQAKDQIYELLYKKEVEKKFKIWINSLKENAHVKILL